MFTKFRSLAEWNRWRVISLAKEEKHSQEKRENKMDFPSHFSKL